MLTVKFCVCVSGDQDVGCCVVLVAVEVVALGAAVEAVAAVAVVTLEEISKLEAVDS